VRLTVIGCAGSYPGPESPASCYLVEHDGHRLVLDLGNGALGALARYADIYDVDAVLLSHLHIDHCADLASYYVARHYRPDGPAPRMPVVGPAGTAARMAAIYDMAEEPGMSADFDFVEHRHDPLEVGPFRITSAPVNHPVAAYAVRVEADGRSIVYSGDTGPCDELVELSRGADLALYEASFLERRRNNPDVHLTAKQAAVHADRAGAARLLLTHLVAWNSDDETFAEARPHYGGDLGLAAPGLVVDL
jgi:ribonuclease BN (tRNA processing enzyme)